MSHPRVIETRCRTAISNSRLPENDYSVNPYHGCSHGCLYCYAIDFTREEVARSPWGENILPRTNICEVLRRQIVGIRRGIVALSTITDPYQHIEARYRLTRRCAKFLLENGFTISIQTKSPLVLRDLDIWEKYADRVDIGITITTLDDRLSRIVEPFAPHPQSRVKALKILSSKNIKTWIFLGPIIPHLNDSDDMIEDIIFTASQTKSSVIFDRINFYPGMKKLMIEHFGDIAIKNMISDADALWWKNVERIIRELCALHDVECSSQKQDAPPVGRWYSRDLWQF